MTASDTPETDAEYARIDGGQCLSGCCSLAHDPDCPVCFDFELMTRFARKLERERDRLAGLLEKADDKLAAWFALTGEEHCSKWVRAEREVKKVHAEIQAALGRGGKE